MLEGVPGVSYRVESSTNLADWVLFNTFLSTNTQMYFEDTPTPQADRKFYRTVPP